MHPWYTTMLAMRRFRNREMRVCVGEEKGEYLKDGRGMCTVSVRIHFKWSVADRTARLLIQYIPRSLPHARYISKRKRASLSRFTPDLQR